MTLLPLVGAAALLLAPSASLAERPVITRVAVGHADLDLSTRHGLAALDTRIARAARVACGYVSPSDLAGRNRLRDCREEARASVVAQRDRLAAARSVEVATVRYPPSPQRRLGSMADRSATHDRHGPQPSPW